MPAPAGTDAASLGRDREAADQSLEQDKARLDTEHASKLAKIEQRHKMLPLVGKIVNYREETTDTEDAPAMVQRVNADDSFRLWVFGPNRVFMVDNVKQAGTGGAAKQWTWPEAAGGPHADHLDEAHTSINPKLDGGGVDAPQPPGTKKLKG